jgi:DNA polymerase-3 subunit delta
MSKPTPSYYVLHGDDDLRIEEEAGKLRARMGTTDLAKMNCDQFDGETAGISEILGAAMALPFLHDKRFVQVKGLLTHITRKGAGETGKKAVAQLERSLPELPPTTRLVFIEAAKLADSHRIVKLARESENGFEKAYLLPSDSSAWIVARARHYDAVIEPRAAAALASIVGSDLRRADSELFKLAAYVGADRAIGEDDLSVLTPYVSEASVFSMVDALAEGKGSTAMKLALTLVNTPDDFFSLYGMIIRQFRLLIMAKEHLSAGGSRDSLPDVLGVSAYPAGKVATQSRAFDLPTLERIYRTLADLDVQVKTGRTDTETALTLLIAGLARG